MSPFHKIFIVAVIFTLITGCSDYTSEKLADINHSPIIYEDSLQLIIEPEYDIYSLGQNVWIKAKIINNSKEDFYLLNDLVPPFINFNIKDSEGKKYNFNMVVDFVRPNDSLKISPGEEYGNIINITNFYLEDLGGADKLQEGIYEISANYSKSMNTPLEQIIYSTIPSNILKIKFIYPEGKDVLFYESYHKMEKDQNGKSKIPDLIEKYPGSVYVPQLLSNLVLNSYYEYDSTKFFKAFNAFMENENSSYDIYYVIGYFSIFAKSILKWKKEDILKSIDSIQNENRGTKKDEAIRIWKEKNDIYKDLLKNEKIPKE